MKHLLVSTLLAVSSISCSSQENPEAAKEAEPITLFNGKDLTGWKAVNPANAKYWSVIDGVITCSNGDKKMPTNTYLATVKNYENFEFKCKFRLSGDHKTGLINSGLQYRSNIHGTKIIGYQADIGKGYWGDIYDEHRRGLLLKADTKALFKDFKEDGWNTYTIRCQGDHHQLFINGHKTADYTEKKKGIPSTGVIALQLHSGGVAKMEYKDITIRTLADPNAAPDPAVLKKGAAIYQQKCTMCHQAQGQGLPGAFPPLMKSEWATGPAENLIRIQLRGLTGEITVAGKKYNQTMPANAKMSDEDIAAVITYVRNSFGNKASAVTPAMVKAHRGEVGKPLLTVKDLKPVK